MPYTVHQAKTNFSRLLKEAEDGKEVIVMRGKKPIAKLVPLTEPSAETGFRRIGGFEGLIEYDESVFEPLTQEQMIEYGFDNPEKDARLAAVFNALGQDFVETSSAALGTTPAKRSE